MAQQKRLVFFYPTPATIWDIAMRIFASEGCDQAWPISVRGPALVEEIQTKFYNDKGAQNLLLVAASLVYCTADELDIRFGLEYRGGDGDKRYVYHARCDCEYRPKDYDRTMVDEYGRIVQKQFPNSAQPENWAMKDGVRTYFNDRFCPVINDAGLEVEKMQLIGLTGAECCFG